MKICLVLISGGWGGAEAVVRELVKCLRDKGENVSIILNQEILKFYGDLERVEIFNIGCVYHPIKLIKSIILPNVDKESSILNSFLSYYLNELLRPIYFKRIRKKILDFLSDKEVDIIHSHLENSDILVSCLTDLKIPWVITIHGVRCAPKYFKKDSTIRSILTFKKSKVRMLKNCWSKADKITEVSKFILNELENQGISLRNKSVVIRNGITLSEFQRDSIPKLKLKENFNLLFPGGAKIHKGGDIIIKALTKVRYKIPNIHLYIALNVPKNHLLRKMVKKLGLEQNVTFLGFLQKEKYREILNSVDILIQMYREESFGIVCLEAMALGKPIIAGNRGLPTFVKNGKNGVFVEPNSDEVADAILYLYKNEDVRKQISQNNLEDIKNFDWGFIVDEYIDFYRKTLIEKREQFF